MIGSIERVVNDAATPAGLCTQLGQARRLGFPKVSTLRAQCNDASLWFLVSNIVVSTFNKLFNSHTRKKKYNLTIRRYRYSNNIYKANAVAQLVQQKQVSRLPRQITWWEWMEVGVGVGCMWMSVVQPNPSRNHRQVPSHQLRRQQPSHLLHRRRRRRCCRRR